MTSCWYLRCIWRRIWMNQKPLRRQLSNILVERCYCELCLASMIRILWIFCLASSEYGRSETSAPGRVVHDFRAVTACSLLFVVVDSLRWRKIAAVVVAPMMLGFLASTRIVSVDQPACPTSWARHRICSGTNKYHTRLLVFTHVHDYFDDVV